MTEVTERHPSGALVGEGQVSGSSMDFLYPYPPAAYGCLVPRVCRFRHARVDLRELIPILWRIPPQSVGFLGGRPETG